jgi:hypothetical protein
MKSAPAARASDLLALYQYLQLGCPSDGYCEPIVTVYVVCTADLQSRLNAPNTLAIDQLMPTPGSSG